MGRRLVNLLNRITRLRRRRCVPESLLILMPSCLQNSRCDAAVRADAAECLRCGRCKVKDIVELAERYGCRCAVATGGRLAVKLVRDKQVDAVVAVACEKELQIGMLASLPKPALGVINVRPNGPCTDTDVDVALVEEAIRSFLGAQKDGDED